MTGTTELQCWLCERPLGRRVEYHHSVPKSRGGRSTVPIHPICHRTLHRHFTNRQLEALALPELKAQPDDLRVTADLVDGKPKPLFPRIG